MTGTRAPRLSVVVPVYNGAGTLAGCLGSVERAVAALTPAERASVEVVVCDNHSTDDTAAIAQAARYACDARQIQPPSHLANRTDNWRCGLSHAAGDWMLMLHADDALVDGALQAWLAAIAGPLAAEVGFIAGRHRTFVDSPDDLSAPHPRLFPVPALMSGRQLARWVLPLLCPFRPFMLMRRTAYEDVGGFDRRFELAQDWDLWIRLCRRYDVLYVPAVIGAFRYHATGAAYQRLNMAEHMTVLEEMQADPTTRLPAPMRWLAPRSMHARVATVLGHDASHEAELIRSRAQALSSPTVWRSARLLKGTECLVSALLYGLRAGGAVRAGAIARRQPKPAR